MLGEVIPRFVSVDGQSPNQRRRVQGGMVEKEALPLEWHELGHPYVEVHQHIGVRRRPVHQL